jgi:ATP-dependent 26S proteasome regulatory subunit
MEEFKVVSPSNRRLQADLVRLISEDTDAGSLGRQLELMHAIRRSSREESDTVDRLLLATITDLRRSIKEAQAAQEELRALVEKMSAPPWHPGRLLRVIEAEGRLRALVHCGAGTRLVEFGDDLDPTSIAAGAPVLLSQDLNLVMREEPRDLLRCGETAFYDRRTADGRLVLRCRDEEVIVDAAGALDLDSLSPGDEVYWDRGAWMAFERIESRAGEQYLIDELLDVGPKSVGGQEQALEELLHALCARLVAPELAAAYGIRGRCSVLLHGPPGCGKTLMARVAAAEAARESGRKCRFFVVKPGEWESPWVGEAQANVRQCFAALQKAADESMAVLFLDEVESVGRHRGGALSQHGDKFTAAWLAELDGFADRGDVAIVSATNRKDLIDPALLQRLSDVEIAVPRPDSRGAGRIFEIHLADGIPVHPDGLASAETRREIIESAVSRLYAPNSENAISVLHFRDGSSRAVDARQLVSGRLIEQICRSACEAAFARQLGGGTAGVRVSDMAEAVAAAIEGLATTMTLRNAHQYLEDLPDDADVVRVERPRRKVKRPTRYLNVA